MSSAYKDEHEAFVSNLKGTSLSCVLVCLAHVPACILLLKLVQAWRRPRILRDLFVLVYPLMFSLTIFSGHGYWSLPSLFSIAFMISQLKGDRRGAGLSSDHFGSTTLEDSQTKLSYLSLFKGSNMLLTCICILAIDFKIFPRRFAKTENFGISLMDVGAGTFVVASAITSRYARGKISLPSVSADARKSSNMLAGVWQKVAVLCLGVGRMIIVKVMNYQEHVSEYGVHWNFFVTLFFLWVLADGAHCILPRTGWSIPIFSLLMLLSYQLLLTHTRLTDFLLSAPRTTFLSQNREGIFSLLGYLPLYLLSEWFAARVFFDRASQKPLSGQQEGDTLVREESAGAFTRPLEEIEAARGTVVVGGTSSSHQRTHRADSGSSTGDIHPVVMGSAPSVTSVTVQGEDETDPAADDENNKIKGNGDPLGSRWKQLTIQPKRRILNHILGGLIVCFTLWVVGTTMQPTSRRLANLPFVAVVLTICLSMIAFLVVVDTIGQPSVHIMTLIAMSEHQLPIFLAANVMTGVVNMAFKTIYVPQHMALLILLLYTTLLVIIAWILKFLATKKNDA
mmetsp:Transcript_14027/g.20977  ORF Transcript_14027/g.20977 Transcript_14027/m.20977 type:complete len:565 (-) Transcript_14027:11-1705(-)